MKEKLRSEFTRLMMSENIETMLECHTKITDVGFTILNSQEINEKKTVWENESNLLFQMTLLKSLTLIKNSNPINHINTINGSKLSNCYDSFSMYSIVRSQYEAFCNFNNIFVQSKTIYELELKYYLWVVSGLNYRLRFIANGVELIKKKAKEKELINDNILKIKSNSCYNQLDSKSKQKINDGIQKREWKFDINGCIANKTVWHEMMTKAGTNELLDNQYTSLSLSTHPSNVSVFQFGAMYRNKMDEFDARMALQLSSIFTAMLIRDYVTYFKNCKYCFDKLPIINQLLINSYNKMFRNDTFAINDTLELLN